MKILQVNLGSRTYPIYIGSQLLQGSSLLRPYIAGKTAMIVTNDVVGPLYLDQLRCQLDWVERLEEVILPDGEVHKNLKTVNTIFDHLLESRLGRTTTLIGLGGGVVGDMVGFAAACYQRGVPFLQVPTTVLAQVDSSVGGKTGVNHALGKNMIGAFHQPGAVLIDTDTLRTLAPREIRAGIAEIIKYGLIVDPAFFDWLEQHIDELIKLEPAIVTHAVARSCEIKAKIVAEDEREQGVRALLNFGHTFGHAIETWQEYGGWLHGEAVAAGMLMAADLSAREGWLPRSAVERIHSLLTRAGLPIEAPAGMGISDFLLGMAVDKKAVDGKMRLILLQSIGEACITTAFRTDNLRKTLSAFCC